jgi:hypothetical protein
MTAFGVSNIDYFPVELVHPLTHCCEARLLRAA